MIKRLLDAGISLQQIRTAVQHLRERGTDDLTRVTLMSDGASVYECTSNDEVIDLLQGGQGVFGIAIGGVWREIEGTLADLPSERSVEAAEPTPGDELAARRAAARLAEPAPVLVDGPAPAWWRVVVVLGPPVRWHADHPARESLRRRYADRSAEGAIPPRNLSGARTVRVRQL